MKLKQNDVVRLDWKEREWGDQKDHCFEGFGVVTIDSDGVVSVTDTYWGILSSSGKTYTKEQAEKLFNIKHYFNLDDVQPIDSHEVDYYDDKDIFRISRQHACYLSCVQYYKKTGSTKSKTKILKVLENNLQISRSDLKYKKREIEQTKEKIEQVKYGNLDIYI